MKQIQTPSKGRAAVAAALSLGLAFGSLSFGAMVSSPTEALAKEESSSSVDSEQSLTIEVKGVCDKVLHSDTLSKAFTIKVKYNDEEDENTDEEDSYPLEYDKEKGIFKGSDIPAGDYIVIIESHSGDFRVIKTDDGVYNGSDILLDNDDGSTVARLTLDGTHTPEAKSLETTVNNTPKAEDGISNKDSMPTGTTYTWETIPNTSAPGGVTGTVRVSYPYGCSETVEVTVKVTAAPDPDPDPEPETPDTPDKPDTPETPEPETPDTPDKPDTPETPETPNNKTPDNPVATPGTDANKVATQPAEQAKPAAPSDVKPKVKPRAQATPQTGDAAGILGTVASFFGAGALGVAAALRRRR